jgi:hypothetical protein
MRRCQNSWQVKHNKWAHYGYGCVRCTYLFDMSSIPVLYRTCDGRYCVSIWTWSWFVYGEILSFPVKNGNSPTNPDIKNGENYDRSKPGCGKWVKLEIKMVNWEFGGTRLVCIRSSITLLYKDQFSIKIYFTDHKVRSALPQKPKNKQY